MKKLLLFALAAAVMAPAAEKWTVEDVLFQESAGGLKLSRDGRLQSTPRAAWTRRRAKR